MSARSTDRRTFVATTGTVLAALAAPPALVGLTREHDLVIRGGTVFDGLGHPGQVRDVAIASGRIVQVAARVDGRATEEIDARGLAVAPGFIDIHSHGDGSLDVDPRAESLIRQGITTIIAGQDGDSDATGADDHPFTALFQTLDGYAPGVNVASMVGLGTVRGAVVGDRDRPATADEVNRVLAEEADTQR